MNKKIDDIKNNIEDKIEKLTPEQKLTIAKHIMMLFRFIKSLIIRK